jgi:RimJ/RimL family protein N-acetyltransferase
MNLERSGIKIRDWVSCDAASLARCANNRNIWLNLRDRFPHPYLLTDAETWIAYCQAETGPDRSYAVEKDGEVMGSVGCTLNDGERRHVVDVGYWIGEPYWGQGIATRVLGMYSEYLFASEDVLRQEAQVYSWNPASCRVLEKTGFEQEACMKNAIRKDGHLLDSWLYAKVNT